RDYCYVIRFGNQRLYRGRREILAVVAGQQVEVERVHAAVVIVIALHPGLVGGCSESAACLTEVYRQQIEVQGIDSAGKVAVAIERVTDDDCRVIGAAESSGAHIGDFG